MTWLVPQLGVPGWPPPVMANGLYLLSDYLFVAAALLLFIGQNIRPGRITLLIDAAILALGAGLIVWAAWLGPQMAARAPAASPLGFSWLYPLGDIGLFLAVLVLLLRRVETRERPLLLLALSLLVLLITDLILGYRFFAGITLGAGVLDLGRLAGYALVGLAGIMQAAVPADQPPAEGQGLGDPWPPRVRAAMEYLPYGALAATCLLLLWEGRQSPPVSFSTLGLTVGGLLLLVLTRELLTLRESGAALRAEQRRQAAGALVLDLSRRLLAAADEDTVANCAAEVSLAALEADCSLLVLADGRGRLAARAGRGWPPDVLPSLVFEPGAYSQAGLTLAKRQPVMVPDYERFTGFQGIDEARRLGIRSGLSAPLEIDGRAVGVLAVHDRTPRTYGEAVVRHLVLIANQTAAAIERVRLFEVTRRQIDELTVLHSVASAGAEAVSEDGLIERVTAIAGEAIVASHLGVMLVDPSSGLLRSHAPYQGDSIFITPIGQGITGHVALTGRPTRVANVKVDPRYVAADPDTLSELCVPLIGSEQVIGVLNAESTQLAAFAEADERLLMTIGRQLATGLERLRLFRRLFEAEQQRAGELEAVRQASLGLTASLDLQAVLQAILQSALRLLADALEAYVFLYHAEDGGRLTFGAARARDGHPPQAWQPRPDGLTQTVARQGDMLLVSDMRQHPLFANIPRQWGGAIAGLPLKIGARVVGVMNVTYPAARIFSEPERRVLRLLGDQAAIAIENARLFEAERAAREQAEALREVAATLNASLDREHLLQLILEQLARVVAYDSASVILSDGDQLAVVAHSGYKSYNQHGFTASMTGFRHLREVVEGRQPVIISDTGTDLRWQAVPGSEYIRCWLGVPLAAQGRVIGLLNLDKVTPHFYAARDAELATAFANQAAATIENARLFEAERRQLGLSQNLQAVGALLTAQLGLHEVFEHIFDLLAEVAAYDSVSVQLLEPDGGMALAAGRGFPDLEAARENVRFVSEQRRAEFWLETPVLVIADTASDPRWIPTAGAEYVRSWIGAALVVKGQLVGILTTDSATPRAYDATTGETVRAFANQAAVAIENARLFEESQRQTRALAGLYDTALATGSVLETDVLLARLYDQVRQLLAPDAFVVTFYHADTDELEVVLAVGDDRAANEAVPTGRLPISQGLSGWVLRNRQSLLVADLQAEPMRVPPRQGVRPARTWLGVPLIAHERIIGVVSVHSFAPLVFGGDDRRYLESVASQVAIAIENARLYAEISARAAELSRLYAAAQDLGAKLEPQAVLGQLARHLTEAVGATSSYVLEVNLPAETVTVLAEYWAADALPQERSADLGQVYSLPEFPTNYQSITRLVVLEKQFADPRLSPAERAEMQRYGIRSAVVVPIVSRGEVLGQAEIWESRRQRVFTLAERRLLRTLCQHAAGVIENARLFEATLQHADEVTTASEILHLLNATSNVTESFPLISAAIRSITGCERVSLATLDAHRTKATILALDRERNELPLGTQLPIAATSAAADVLAGQIHLTPDLAAEMSYPAEAALYAAGFRSRLNLPLRVGREVIGALSLVWRQSAGYARANLSLLNQLVDAVALAIEKTRLFDETRRRDAFLEALAYASGKLLTAIDADDAMPDTLAQLGRAAGVSRAYIVANTRLADGTLGATPRYEWRAPGQHAPGPTTAWERLSYVQDGMERWQQTLSAGRPLDGLVRDFPLAERQRLERQGVLSLAVVPIASGGEWWGWLGFDDCEMERAWSGAEIEALKSAASALGAFLDRQRTEAAESEQRALAEALRDTAAVLNSTLDLDEVLDHILADVGHVVPHDSANILLIEDGATRVVRNRDLRGHFPDGVMLAVRYPVLEVPNLRYMLETGQPAIVSDTHDYAGWIDQPETGWIRSLVGAPIRIKGRVIGFITLDNSEPGFYRLAHAERLQAFAHQAGLAIENAQLYASIRQHAMGLEQRVVERTRELADANRRLRELDRLKDQFISNVSHELRTPLTNIKLHLGLLEKRGPEVMSRYLPTLQRETERLRRLIEDLLDLSRLQTQSEPLQRERHSLDELIAEVLTLHSARADAKGLVLRQELNSAATAVPLDRAQMIQVFTNLIGNAVAYTPPGGHATVSSALHRLGNTRGVSISFTNDGPPIPPEDLPHLFRRFYRGRTAHDSGEPGTGLGLSICREIVERHGGQIDVTSTPAQGTTFMVWLPLD
ncbi:MAG: GAF domain-containing protein [Anaerolineales bacterium]|nr:GAF domain-containing protein [Anaerolineales bacterium]